MRALLAAALAALSLTSPAVADSGELSIRSVGATPDDSLGFAVCL